MFLSYNDIPASEREYICLVACVNSIYDISLDEINMFFEEYNIWLDKAEEEYNLVNDIYEEV